ncbi:hypothetical protein Leryth_005062 [Lithospermum erythrorhizon]|nr:hypothetical protein Leryth_005062 [Lithospermum erythrorhizon]
MRNGPHNRPSHLTTKHISCLKKCQNELKSNPQHIVYMKIRSLGSCIASLQSFAQQKNLKSGKQLHAYMIKHGQFSSSPQSTTSLVNMYSKCNSIKNALNVFTVSPHGKNVFCYNAIIAGLINNGFPKQCLEFFYEMRVNGVIPDKFTVPCVVKACLDSLEMRKIHGLLLKLGLAYDLFVGSALVHSCLKFGLIDEALQVFCELPEHSDAVIWNALVHGFSENGEFLTAVRVFGSMMDDGIMPTRFSITGILSALGMLEDVYNGRIVHCLAIKVGCDNGIAVLNALIDMYGKGKFVSEALEIFDGMVERDIFSWNSIIGVHEQCGDHEFTLRLFERMLRQGIIPDLITVTSVLPSCARLAALRQGEEIHGYMIVNGWMGNAEDRMFDDTFIDNAIMDMYAKCGSMREARALFDEMSYNDVASWNIMIMGYGMHGHGKEALDVFYHMCEAGVMPNDITFVGVLSACSHAGLLKQGQDFLSEMQPIYGISPAIEHYTSVIDMLGRAGKLEEALGLLSTMPIKDNSVVWRAFLAACQLHNNPDLAEIAAKRVLELEPEHCGSYVILSNIYGARGRYEDVRDVRHSMRQQNVKKTPGCSWIELSNGVHVFVTSDKNHPEEDLIYAGLGTLINCMGEDGFTLDTILETW